jgi:hypothetical protein
VGDAGVRTFCPLEKVFREQNNILLYDLRSLVSIAMDLNLLGRTLFTGGHVLLLHWTNTACAHEDGNELLHAQLYLRCKVPQCFHHTVFPSLFGEHSKTGKTRFSVCRYCQSRFISSNVLLGNTRMGNIKKRYRICSNPGNRMLGAVTVLRCW